ncbi:MAG: pectate lyase [Acidimicrobiia bacterium]|nr:pectate lyase [Acidimicrobiia bacterium]
MILLIPLVALVPAAPAEDPLPAFPGAEGFGAHAEGGRGGDVAIVTNLDDSGPGSLRHAVTTASGPRTVTFEIAGTIDLESPLAIVADHLTIAGQTSPGGITLRGYPVTVASSSHVVLRYLRVRPGDVNAAGLPGKPGRGNADLAGDAGDALSVVSSEHVIVDHVSASWGMDETLSVTDSADVTVQHSIISESLNDSFHAEGPHGYGSLVRGTGERGYTFAHNLWAHHQRRMPAFGGDQYPEPGESRAGIDLDLVGNVVYDWSLLPVHIVEGHADLRVNLEGNTFVSGPGAPGCACVLINFEVTADELAVHRAGNVWDDDGDGTADPRPVVDTDAAGPVTWVADHHAFDRPPPTVADPATAYNHVLAEAGTSLDRDAADRRVVADVADRSGSVINTQDEVGGWPTVASEPAPADDDRDGMGDSWEASTTTSTPPIRPTATAKACHGAYTNLEVYLAALAA